MKAEPIKKPPLEVTHAVRSWAGWLQEADQPALRMDSSLPNVEIMIVLTVCLYVCSNDGVYEDIWFCITITPAIIHHVCRWIRVRLATISTNYHLLLTTSRSQV